ncbi:GNAT family N-acetyltransferase [Streptomyces anulatus]|uniref:GNAT family N-acetyltransferase n=1 Tax=Streptomyces anulatus TaxID=1892 RepID=UPI00363FA566
MTGTRARTTPSRSPGSRSPHGARNSFYARPESWGTGVGRSLMRSTLSVWAERGTRAGYLWVLERNTRGRDFYRKGGWRPHGRPLRLRPGRRGDPVRADRDRDEAR